MSEEQNVNLYAEAKEALETAKDDLSEARSAERKFKKANKIRKIEKIEDEEVKKEYLALQKATAAALEAKKAAEQKVAELKPPKGSGGGAAKYSYAQIKDKETGEMRDLEASEKKRWRGHARKVAKRDDNEFTSPEQVPFDPTFFDPKPKKEKKAKKAKEDEAPEEKAPEEKAPEEKVAPRKSRRKRS